MKRLVAFFALIPMMLLALTDADRTRLDRHYPKTLERIDENQPISLQDVKNLTRAGVSDHDIINIISRTRSTFYLSPDDVEELTQAGVSKKVINHMRDTADVHF